MILHDYSRGLGTRKRQVSSALPAIAKQTEPKGARYAASRERESSRVQKVILRNKVNPSHQILLTKTEAAATDIRLNRIARSRS